MKNAVRTALFTVLSVLISISALYALPHAEAQVQDEETSILLIDTTNFMTLADETKNMSYKRATETFQVFIDRMEDQPAKLSNPLYMNNYIKRVMRMVMAYKALCGVCPKGKFFQDHILLTVLEDQLSIIELTAKNSKKRNKYIDKSILKEISDNACRKLEDKSYSRIIYEY